LQSNTRKKPLPYLPSPEATALIINTMKPEEMPAVTPIEEQRASALKHYKEASDAICHWSGFVEAAIKAYKPDKPLFGEYQLCPKCYGTGFLQPPYEVLGTNVVTGICYLCNGKKVIAKPIQKNE
jgi:hypothetical protein